MPEIRSVSNTKLKIFSYFILQHKIAIHTLMILRKAFANKCVNGPTKVVRTLNIITPRHFHSLIVFIISLLQTILTQTFRENVFK